MRNSQLQLEQGRLDLLNRLDAAKGQAERNRLGQFATPPSLAAEIVECAGFLLPPDSRIRFLEPGFGTGAFYSALLRTVAKSRIAQATGYETNRSDVFRTRRKG
jgi:hypothetical protein